MAGLLGHRGLLLTSNDPMLYAPDWMHDPSDLSTLFQDSAGTVPVTADGDPVGRYQDKSGFARHWIQPIAGARPIYRTDGTSHWLQFNGSAWMYGITPNMLAFPNLAAFIAYRPESGVANFGCLIGQPHATSHNSPYFRWNLNVRTGAPYEMGIMYNGSHGQVDYDPAALGNDVLSSGSPSGMWVHEYNGVWNAVLRANRTLRLANSPGTTTITYPSSTNAVLGANVDGSGDFFKGRIYGDIGKAATLTTQAPIDAFEIWLQSKMP